MKIPLSQVFVFLQVFFNIVKSLSLFVSIQGSQQNCNDLTVMWLIKTNMNITALGR